MLAEIYYNKTNYFLKYANSFYTFENEETASLTYKKNHLIYGCIKAQ